MKLTTFICKVMTPQGQVVKIKIQEKDKISCLKKLKKNGMTPISIEPSKLNIFKQNNDKKLTATIHAKKKRKLIINKEILNEDLGNRVSYREIKEFTIDFYTLKKSNFTNEHALKTLINKTENNFFRKILINILNGQKQGKYIYKTMKEYNDVFPIIYINLIKTGELTDSFETSLEYAISYLENEEKLRNKVKKVLIPNIVSFFGIILMLILAVLIIIPNLQSIFRTYGINVYLPGFVLFFSRLVRFILKYWYVAFAIILIALIAFIRFLKDENGRYKFDKFKYKNFIFGKLFFLLDFSRIIRSIYLNLQNKMRLEDALEISKQVVKNTYMMSLIEKSINNVYTGKSWYDSFEDEKMINPIILELLKQGSKAKSIHTFDMAIQYLDREIEKEISRTLRILPEISYVLVGVALLVFIVTILVPCIQIYLGGLLFI